MHNTLADKTTASAKTLDSGKTDDKTAALPPAPTSTPILNGNDGNNHAVSDTELLDYYFDCLAGYGAQTSDTGSTPTKATGAR